MKTLLYLGIILMLCSCGSNESESAISTVKIGNLEVMTKDLGEMTWDDAMKACADLGDGWRLPTKDELNLLYENKEKIGGFVIDNYWSSTKHPHERQPRAWMMSFMDTRGYQYGRSKASTYYVRAVRDF